MRTLPHNRPAFVFREVRGFHMNTRTVQSSPTLQGGLVVMHSRTAWALPHQVVVQGGGGSVGPLSATSEVGSQGSQRSSESRRHLGAHTSNIRATQRRGRHCHWHCSSQLPSGCQNMVCGSAHWRRRRQGVINWLLSRVSWSGTCHHTNLVLTCTTNNCNDGIVKVRFPQDTAAKTA